MKYPRWSDAEEWAADLSKRARWLGIESRACARAMCNPELCSQCGETAELEVHHLNGHRFDNRRQNLAVLCRSCHAEAHKTVAERGKKTKQHPRSGLWAVNTALGLDASGAA